MLKISGERWWRAPGGAATIFFHIFSTNDPRFCLSIFTDPVCPSARPSQFLAELSRSLKFGWWLRHPETGPKSIGIGLVPVCGHRPGHFGLGFLRCGGDWDPNSSICGRILKSVRGPFSGYLKAVWPGFLGAFLRARRPGPQKCNQTNQARLPLCTQF
jgi:hypothetical protein